MASERRVHAWPALMSLEIAGEYLSLSKDKVYDMAAAGAFPLRKVGTRTLILKSDLDDWIERNFKGAAA